MKVIDRVTATIENAWRLALASCSNPFGITEDMIDESKKKCPPKEFKDATYKGTYVVPRGSIRYDLKKQPRDKGFDPQHVNNLENSHTVNGYINGTERPIVEFDQDNTEESALEGVSGFNRNEVYTRTGQDVVMVDIYVFHTPRARLIARNTSNHHLTPALNQTKNDYIKEVCNAVDSGWIQSTKDDIDELVDEIASDKTTEMRLYIKRTCYNNCQTFPNFLTYNSSGSKKSSNTLPGFCVAKNLPQSGIEHRSKKELKAQGYILYFAAQGDNKATWARAIINSIRFGIPVLIIGYAAERPKDGLKIFRKEWIKDYIETKELFIKFAKNIINDGGDEFNESNFEIKIAGFLPQYIKANPEDSGKPTETEVVDIDGNPVVINPDCECLSLQ